MKPVRFLSLAEQVAAHLREELLRARWNGTVPGTPSLAEDLGVNSKTVTEALTLLEREGLLESRGAGRSRRITVPEKLAPLSLRVAILKQKALDRGPIMLRLRHRLEEAGFPAFESDKALLDLGMDPLRVARHVRQVEADAWVVCGGSLEVLEWFAEQSFPTFAMLGRRQGLPIAGTGPSIGRAVTTAVSRLVQFGHHRIALLVRELHRRPTPSLGARVFLDALHASGIATSGYNLPDWEESADGLRERLDSMFRFTPPTALIVNESFLFNAVYHYLAGRGLRVPQDVSLICTEVDQNHDWCRPTVAHIRWDHGPPLRRLVRWAGNVARGKDDRQQTDFKAEFVEGGTIGPAPRGR